MHSFFVLSIKALFFSKKKIVRFWARQHHKPGFLVYSTFGCQVVAKWLPSGCLLVAKKI